ncbi:PQQ-dependent sugar dehydrogenase, partial [Streptomyces sp. TRM76130]|nr:PQQ-dependent sugar dehydrogenase [Streptomyces sp. TRM76130]
MIVQRRAVPAALAAALLLTAGCSSGDGDGPAGSTSPSGTSSPASSSAGRPAASTPPAEGSVRVTRTVATGLDSPWGLAPLPDGDLLVSSRDQATITRVDTETGEKTVLGEVPGVSP